MEIKIKIIILFVFIVVVVKSQRIYSKWGISSFFILKYAVENLNYFFEVFFDKFEMKKKNFK
jgi:hypothetical protein